MNDGWISMNGCNACINTLACEHHGNCVLLSVDRAYPENSKKKRRIISRIRTAIGYAHRLGGVMLKPVKEDAAKEVVKVRLTRVERMFVDKVKQYTHENKS